MCPQPECNSEEYIIKDDRYPHFIICVCVGCGTTFIKLKRKE